VALASVRVAGVGELSRPRFPLLPAGSADPTVAMTGQRKVYLQGSWQDVKIYDRSLLKAGSKIPGPAVIEQVDSTTFFYAEQDAAVATSANIIIRLKLQ